MRNAIIVIISTIYVLKNIRILTQNELIILMNVCTLVFILNNKLLNFTIMLNKILKLEGASTLSKNEQKEIKGKGGDLLACTCPDGSRVIAHGNSCEEVIGQFCAADM